MRILVIGGYGFIGRAVGEALLARGHETVGWGRSAALGRKLLPDAQWIAGDLRHMASPADWNDVLAGVDAVVNASGALQDGADGRLGQVQGRAIVALIDACAAAGIRRFVQISAPGATADADTGFMASKAVADAYLRASGLDWTILRPALVIGRNAYGGTALLRALAAFPVQLTVHGDSLVQCVALDEVAAACVEGVEGRSPPRSDLILAAPERLTLRDAVVLHRRWLGLPPAKHAMDLPPAFAAPIAWAADIAGWFGWRSPLRSTALRVMGNGVVADDTSDAPRASLARILAANPAGLQDRLAARLFLLQPLIILSLAALWIGSGIVGLIRTADAAALLGGSDSAATLVRACSILDLMLGGAILVRAWARRAALGMAIVSLLYLIASAVLTPALWLDPLAPLLKILPALMLALVAAAILERR